MNICPLSGKPFCSPTVRADHTNGTISLRLDFCCLSHVAVTHVAMILAPDGANMLATALMSATQALILEKNPSPMTREDHEKLMDVVENVTRGRMKKGFRLILGGKR